MPRILFASLPLRLMMPADRVAAAAQGVKELVFRTLPSANKIEIKRMLERLYGLPVESVNTVNYEDKKRRSRAAFYRKADYKVAYVKLTEAVKIPAPPPKPVDAKAKTGAST